LSWYIDSPRLYMGTAGIIWRRPLIDEREIIWVTCWKVDYRVYSDVLRLCNEKVFVNLEALAFGAKAEFDNIRTSCTID
jgi:hypothetical protein